MGFGMEEIIGLRRVPLPPTSRTALVSAPIRAIFESPLPTNTVKSPMRKLFERFVDPRMALHESEEI